MRANTKYNRFLDYANHPSVVATLTGLLLLAVSANMASFQIQVRADAQPTPALPTAERILVFATAPAATPAAVVSAVGENRTRAALVAYDAPGGNVLGAIEAGRTYTVTAAYGVEWLQADVSGSGLVWLKAAPLLGRPEGIADLEPTAEPRVVYQQVPVETNVNGYADAAPTPSNIVDNEALRQQRTAGHYANGRP